MENQLNKIKDDIYSFIEYVDIKDLVETIKYANDKYYNEDVSIMSDDQYDLLKERLEELSPKHPLLKEIGARVHTKNKAKLPYHMGSMDKIKPDDTKLPRWYKKYKGPYILADKLDGVSALLNIKNGKTKLYTRGNGEVGTDVSSLISLIPNLRNILLDRDVAVRGEIIISSKNFKKYEKKTKNARNMVSGVVNGKSTSRKVLKDVEFIAYELLSPRVKQSEQYKILKKLNFTTAYHISVDTIDDEILSDHFDSQRKNNKYDIDGIVVTDDNKHLITTDGNPKYAFAYKHLIQEQVKDVKVLEVEWRLSKDGLFKPRLKIEPTNIDKVTINYVTAFNARFVVENKIGPNSIIKLTRSGGVIPHIIGIVKKTKEQMPTLPYKWNSTKVDICYVMDEDDDDEATNAILAKNIRYFFKKLKIKYIDQRTVEKMIDIGMDAIPKVLNADIEDLEEIEGFETKMATKIYDEITRGIDNVELPLLMAASNIFDRGIGERKSKLVLKHFPKILKSKKPKDELIDMITTIDGFNTKTATIFVDGINNFNKFLSTVPMVTIKKSSKPNQTKLRFKDLKIVFTGFRKKEWENAIEEEGGKISSSVSKNTNILVVKDLSNKSSKVTKAQKLGVIIMGMDGFEKKYKF
jgi:DNA ligase (NAD+)